MKILCLTTFVVTICYVSAGKTQRLLAAMMAANMNPGMLAAANGGIVNPALMGRGINLPVGGAGGAGFFGQPVYAPVQLVPGIPGLPAFAAPAPVPNVYPMPAVNTLPFPGLSQMAAVNPPQQPAMGAPGGVMTQQLPPQVDPLRRFRRQIIVKQEDVPGTTLDTQIPAPDKQTTLCDGDRKPNNN